MNDQELHELQARLADVRRAVRHLAVDVDDLLEALEEASDRRRRERADLRRQARANERRRRAPRPRVR